MLWKHFSELLVFYLQTSEMYLVQEYFPFFSYNSTYGVKMLINCIFVYYIALKVKDVFLQAHR